jgi:uncharacterized protein YndB with AHSA1/START domain
LITIAMRTSIGATRERIWRALTEPSERVAWDASTLAAVDPTEGYPSSERIMRWRYRLGSVQVVLCERPREVVPTRKLRCSLSIGSLRFEQTYNLASESAASDASGSPSTQLGIKLTAQNTVPVVDGMVDRFEIRDLATQRVDELMRSLQRWCEKDV